MQPISDNQLSDHASQTFDSVCSLADEIKNNKHAALFYIFASIPDVENANPVFSTAISGDVKLTSQAFVNFVLKCLRDPEIDEKPILYIVRELYCALSVYGAFDNL